MPRLKNIHIHQIVTDAGLLALLASHAHVLESVWLKDCVAVAIHEEEGKFAIYWKDLFSALVKEVPRKMLEFKVSPSDPLKLLDPNGRFWDSETRQESQDAVEYLRTHPERRLFHYSWFFNMELCVDYRTNLKSFQQGEDQNSYDRLMRIVERNCANAKGES
jgi:hypothetical protein